MPGKELSVSMDAPPSSHHSLLKAHKAFPRRSVHVSDSPLAAATQSQLWQHERQHVALPKSAVIESWIPEPDVVHLTLEHSLPLTPPSNSPEAEGMSWIEGPLPDDNKVTTRSVSSGIETPVIQRSPPTPETTPPRANQISQNPARPQIRANQSIGTRTDSFRTARENLSSDDESNQPESPSMRPARQKWLQQTAHTRLRDVGLGLGLESPSDDASLRGETPKASPKKQEFVTFDGSWGARQDDPAAISDGAGATGDTKTGIVESRKVSVPPPEQHLTVENDAVPSAQTLSLRQRLEKTRHSPTSVSTEEFAKEINWPLQKDEHLDLDAKVREVDNRRFSQMSTASTVEAVVIDSPSPRRRQTLRHTGKFSKLDSANMNSNRNSLVSTHGSVRPRKLRHTGSPDQIKRGSFASERIASEASSQLRKQKDSIPVIVIPERRSSLSSSAPGSRRISRTTSLTPRQQSSRPVTAPQEATRDFDGRHRTASAKLPAIIDPKEQRKASRERIDAPIEVPGVSANTSRKVSRATSATSGSGIIFNGLQQNPALSKPAIKPDSPPEASLPQSSILDRSISGEWSTAMRPRSTQVTPFSLRSAHSSTPGTLEVNEATAISIYPHTNKSILVVQQLPHQDSSEPTETSAIVASNASFALPGRPAVLRHVNGNARKMIESPSLIDPRDPPQPPPVKVIPPTPVPNFSPVPQDWGRNTTRSMRFSRPFTGLKRALSAPKRQSDAIPSPLTKGLHRGSSDAAPDKRFSTTSDKERNLHPFWRPRAFWDDVCDSDSDSEFGNDGLLMGNSLGMSPAPVGSTVTKIYAQPPKRTQSLTRRFSNSLRFPGRRRNSVAGPPVSYRKTFYEQSDEGNWSYEFIQPQSQSQSSRRGEGNGVPRGGYQVQFVGFKGLAERMEKRKERIAESRRERLREKLKGSGGIVGGVQSWEGSAYGGGA